MSSTQNLVVRYLSDPANYGDLWRVIARVHRRAPFLVEEDDLFQDAALGALSARNQFSGDSYREFLAWFRTIAQRQLIDYIRGLARRGNRFELVQDVQRERSEESDLTEIRDFLENVFSQLTPMEAALLRARHVAGFSHEQIARLINKNPDAVRQTHSRLLRHLRKQYSKDFR